MVTHPKTETVCSGGGPSGTHTDQGAILVGPHSVPDRVSSHTLYLTLYRDLGLYGPKLRVGTVNSRSLSGNLKVKDVDSLRHCHGRGVPSILLPTYPWCPQGTGEVKGVTRLGLGSPLSFVSPTETVGPRESPHSPLVSERTLNEEGTTENRLKLVTCD